MNNTIQSGKKLDQQCLILQILINGGQKTLKRGKFSLGMENGTTISKLIDSELDSYKFIEWLEIKAET